MHEDSVNERSKKPSWFNIASLVLATLSFFGGHLVTVVTGWTAKNEQLSTVQIQMNKLSNNFDTFMDRYNSHHETTSNELTAIRGELMRINEHLAVTDGRVTKLESGRQR